MTPWHYRWLCQFAYIDLPQDILPNGQKMHDIAWEMIRRSENGQLECGKLSDADCEMLRIIAVSSTLSELRLIDYVNMNRSTGFAAYAFYQEGGIVHCVFRGSEGYGCGVPSVVDWIDNFLSPFCGSVQYADIERFVGQFKSAAVIFSGHSKGAHNALYALARSDGNEKQAVVFNGQGFAPGQFTRSEKMRLRQFGINYVTRGDVVGALLKHPEQRIFVQRCKGTKAHSLESISFDKHGQPIEARRPIWSRAVEWGSSRTVRLAVHK